MQKDVLVSTILHNGVKPLKKSDLVSDALCCMDKNSISSVVITDENNSPIGIFTERDTLKIVSSAIDCNTQLSEVMTKNVFCIDAGTYIHDAYILMEQHEYRHIVVVNKKNEYMGVITEGDFLRHMGFEDAANVKLVKDNMNKSILTITPKTSLVKAAQLMTQKKCDYAVVMSGTKPQSVIHERDITKFLSNHSNIHEASIEEVNHHRMYVIKKDASLKEASEMMSQHGVHQLVVVDAADVLVGLISRHDLLKAMHRSYFDYLYKTIEAKVQREKELLLHKEELEKLANYDQLTKLPNRLFFLTYLKKSVARMIRNKQKVAVVLFGLDRFKDINDSYGHNIGDEVLYIITQRLLKRVREGDFLSRLGGDEFALILENIDSANDVSMVLREMLSAISAVAELSNGVELHIEASAGVTIAPNDSTDVRELLQYADSALNDAKKSHKGYFSYYTNEMTQKAQEKVTFENALHNSIKNGELELYYQPQVYIQTGKIISAEALIRWNHPEKGLVSPNVFIPIAEESGLINSIGEWVIHEACRQGKIWEDAGYNLTIAVNVSASQIKYQNIPKIVQQAIQESGYSASKLEIELTESSLMQREENVVEMLHLLRAKEIRLAIDDFGTGYSSLSYLKRFPIDVLKIDKSFIDELPHDQDDAAITVAVIEMSKALGYQVLAEGVENEEQLAFLKQKGCTMYQGYIKSKPLPAQEFEALLRACLV
ncbi:MAG: EAL domain-containing protein [Sulfurimonas sp.]|uniref:EAL domain-containing protein n=1 Tax=Sulfurimonas sp. TaxID=2022749 RepID=UPI002603485F|nr:EAL domain-containing protein [Sulfurimonas sp.]MDD2652871.1 EAL domain-containing protein [Sulfurimonas sp.]MDD3452317.1 EAL domain-containing protein [Sulfurimonas sp.]